MPTLQAKALEEFAGALFIAAGISGADAKVVAASLVAANLRGHDSHGVMRIPYYISAVQERRLDPGAELKVTRETPAAVVSDAGWGFGQVQARRLLGLLIPKAKSQGIACGAMQRSGHIGRVGEYAELAAEHGLAFIAMVNTHGAAPRVAPPGGKRPRLGTNPLCVGVPTGPKSPPIVLDFGTSATAEGKVRVKRIAGQSCPPGWIIDAEGKPTTDPNVLYGDPAGSILPMGGDQAYKGFGLGLVIDMLAGGLSGGLCTRPNPDPPLGNDVVFIVIDPAQLGGTTHFLAQVTGAAEHVRTCPTAEGVREILLPGDPERNTLAVRSTQGIPIDDGNWKQLVDLATKLGVPVPSQPERATERRTLRFGTLDDIQAEVDRLAMAKRLLMQGNWSFGQILWHLAKVMNDSIDGTTIRWTEPAPVIPEAIKRRVLGGSMRAGFKLPPDAARELVPPPTADADGLKAFRAAIQRQHAESKREPNPFFGPLTLDEWNQLHCRHAELHLSFVVPDV